MKICFSEYRQTLCFSSYFLLLIIYEYICILQLFCPQTTIGYFPPSKKLTLVCYHIDIFSLCVDLKSEPEVGQLFLKFFSKRLSQDVIQVIGCPPPLGQPQKNVLLLMVGPLRPNSPPPSSLMAVENLELCKKKVPKKVFFP